MSPHEHQAVAHRFLTAVHEGNFALATELLAPTYVFHLPGSPTAGDWESRKLLSTLLYDAFPDLQTTIQEQVIAGEQVITYLLYRGTHQGDFQGVSPTGHAVMFSGSNTLRIEDGKIVEEWHQVDIPGLLQQLRPIPTVTQADA